MTTKAASSARDVKILFNICGGRGKLFKKVFPFPHTPNPFKNFRKKRLNLRISPIYSWEGSGKYCVFGRNDLMIAQIIAVVLILVGVGLDQLSKWLVVSNMELHESIEIIPGVLRFTYIQNDGAAFGSLDDARWVFMILSTVAIVGILVYMFWRKPENKLMLAALSLVVSGGIGNMIDRVALGYVIDFIDFCAFPEIWMWVFNIADSFVCIGAGMLMLWLILDMIREAKEEKAKKAAALTDTAKEENDD